METINNKEMRGVFEALLFAWGDALESADFANIINIGELEAERILDEMMEEYNSEDRGIQIIKFNKSYQLGTKPKFHEWINKLASSRYPKAMSNAALETLSIIAYRQPITKIDIDNIRGIKSDRVIATLLERELIRIVGRLDRIGKPITYGTTDNFLKAFGLKELEELPPLNFVSEKDLDNIFIQNKERHQLNQDEVNI